MKKAIAIELKRDETDKLQNCRTLQPESVAAYVEHVHVFSIEIISGYIMSFKSPPTLIRLVFVYFNEMASQLFFGFG